MGILEVIAMNNENNNKGYGVCGVSFKKLLSIMQSSKLIDHHEQLNYKQINEINNFIPPMNRNPPYLNKYTKQKQLEITDTYHNLNMREIKPITSKLMEHTDNIVINNSKRQKIKEVREIEIQRQNRSLLQKISSTMSKKSTYSKPISKNINSHLNRSLNQIFRKKQEESIVQENKRFLVRLQHKKPTFNLQKINRDWKDNKSVIKRMAHYEFYLTNFKPKDNHHFNRTGFNSERSKIESLRIKKTAIIDGHKMRIKICFENGMLNITADTLNSKNLKVIEIPKDEAVMMVDQECDGVIDKLIEKIRYNVATDTIFIVSKTLQDNPEEKKHSIPIKLTDKKSSIQSLQPLDESKNKGTIKSSKHQQMGNVQQASHKIQPQDQQFEEQLDSSIKLDDLKFKEQKQLPLQGKSNPLLQEGEKYEQQFEEISPAHQEPAANN